MSNMITRMFLGLLFLLIPLVAAQYTCKVTKEGQEYMGTKTVTKSGRQCQRWDSQSPHSHYNNNPDYFPDASLTDAANYCRNPDNEDDGPWCYTTDSNVRWEFCDIPLCAPTTCKITQQGQEYVGTKSVTTSGKTCQRWDSQSPHSHYNNNPDYFPDSSLSEAANYCRNPDNDDGPWCYTTDPSTRWEFCDIPKCGDDYDQGEDTDNNSDENTDGNSNENTDGNTGGNTGGSSTGDEWADGCVLAHNRVRALHQSTPQIRWNANLAAQAQSWVDKMAPTGSVPHSYGSYGENIYMQGGFDSTTKPPCANAVYAWYRECVHANYVYSKPYWEQTGGVTGHFTQVVWKDSTEVGCGMAVSGTSWYIVCQYLEQGNMRIIGNEAAAINNVAQLKPGAQHPDNPADLMAECKDMYESYCPLYRSSCSDSWGQDFGPATLCPKTCNEC